MSPYRALPVVAAPRPRSVCVWCKHSRRPYQHGVLVCDAREHVEAHPIEGTHVVDRGRDCYVVRDSLRRAGTEDCPDFDPSLVTRVLRAIGGRR